MLILDMTDLSQATLQAVVAGYCSPFGYATSIKVLPPDCDSELGTAEIEMPTPDAAEDLARKFGDSRRGSRVVVMLVQQARSAASALI